MSAWFVRQEGSPTAVSVPSEGESTIAGKLVGDRRSEGPSDAA